MVGFYLVQETISKECFIKKTKNLLIYKYMSFIVTSKYIDCFICFAREECIYYTILM